MDLIPEGYIKRTSSTINWGYELDEATGYLKPIPEHLSILKEVAEAVFHNEISLGIGIDWLEAETGTSNEISRKQDRRDSEEQKR